MMGTMIDSEWKTRMQYSGNNVVYVGEAQPSANTGSLVWRIKKFTYSGNLVTQIDWASGNNGFKFSWDNRASYTYS